MKRVLVFIVVVFWVLMLTTTEAIAQKWMIGLSSPQHSRESQLCKRQPSLQ
jgi:hypothetical protein